MINVLEFVSSLISWRMTFKPIMSEKLSKWCVTASRISSLIFFLIVTDALNVNWFRSVFSGGLLGVDFAGGVWKEDLHRPIRVAGVAWRTRRFPLRNLERLLKGNSDEDEEERREEDDRISLQAAISDPEWLAFSL